METITLTIGTYQVQEYFDPGINESGIEIYSLEGKLIGVTNEFSIIPTMEDEEEYDSFLSEIETIIFENE